MRIISNAVSTMIDPPNAITPHSTPPGYRRVSSIRSTTLNWLKGGTKSSNSKGGAKNKEDKNILPNANDAPIVTWSASHAMTQETSESVTGTDAFNTTHPFSLVDIIDRPQSRVASGELPLSEEVEVRPSSPRGLADSPLTELSSNERPDEPSSHEEILSSPPGGTGKRAAAKIKMALSILRRRSNSNLRKAYGVSSEEHKMGRIKAKNNGPLVTSGTAKLESSTDFMNPSSAVGIPKISIAPTNYTHHPCTALTNVSPNDARRQRRATVGSIGFDENNFSNDCARPNGWLSFDGQPSSSQSSIPGMTTIQGDEFSAIGILSPDSNGIGMTGSVVGAGLHPRPPSLKRHFSGKPEREGESQTSLIENSLYTNSPTRAGNESDKIRRLSFSGICNSYGKMKITEAASLESRVRELESQIATLQSFLVQQKLPSKREPEPDESNLASEASVLGLPPREEVKRPFTASSASTFTQKETTMIDENLTPSTSTCAGAVDWSSIGRDCPSTAPIAPLNHAQSEVTSPDEARNRWERRFEMLNVIPGSSVAPSKHSTVSTLTPGRGREIEPLGSQLPPTTISVVELTELIAMIQREHRARKRLEARISRLQEQISLVLHRQLIIEDRGTTIFAAEASSCGHVNRDLPKRSSNEIPTPDLTPPREIGPRMFSGFDSSVFATESEYEDSYMGEPEGSELWETPTEDAQSVVETRVDFSKLHSRLQPDTLSPLPLMQQRTMSISQITEKASAASGIR